MKQKLAELIVSFILAIVLVCILSYCHNTISRVTENKESIVEMIGGTRWKV